SDALVGDDDPFNSKQQRMMRDFYDDKLSQTLAAQHRSGIADLLIKQLGQREKP
ncbi:rod-binding protein, partial [Serratia sp. M24T3]